MVPSDKSEQVFTTETAGAENGQNIGSILADQDSDEFKKLMSEVENVENMLVPAAEEEPVSPKPEPATPKPDLKGIDMDVDDGPVLVPPAQTNSLLATVALKKDAPSSLVIPPPAPMPTTELVIDLPAKQEVAPEPSIDTSEILFPEVSAADYPIAIAAAEADKPEATEGEAAPKRASREHHDPQHANDLHQDVLPANKFEEGRRASLLDRLKNRKKASALFTPIPTEAPEAITAQPVEQSIEKVQQAPAPEPEPVSEPTPTPTPTLEPVVEAPEKTLVINEQLIEQDSRLKGLQLLGREIAELRKNEDASGKLEAKLQIFNDIYEFYEQKGLNAEALQSIRSSAVELQAAAPTSAAEPAEAAPTKESTAPQPLPQAPTLPLEPISAVEAPEQKEVSKLQKMKNWFRKEATVIQEFSGLIWLQDRWDRATDWLMNRGISDFMTEAEKVERKNINRRNALIGVVGVAIVAGLSKDFDIFAGLNPVEALPTPELPTSGLDIGGASGAEVGGHEGADLGLATPQPQEAQEVHATPPAPVTPEPQPEAPTSIEPEVAPAQDTVDNPAFNIPDGGTGIGLFEKLGLDASAWDASAHTLLERFPGDFYNENGDIRLARSGWLSSEARQFILDLKWGIRG